MKNLLAACFIILAFASASFAKLMPVPLSEVIANSDLIVIGTLKEVSERKEGGTIYGKGKIVVEEFIAGNIATASGFKLKTGDELRLNYIEGFVCVYGSHKRIENQKGVFLLALDDNGEIQYEDFWTLVSLAEIRSFLKKGVNPREVFKTIKTQNEAEQNTQIPAVENSRKETPEISFGVYSLERKINYHLISAFLVILASFSLYYLLYRSRFKIR